MVASMPKIHHRIAFALALLAPALIASRVAANPPMKITEADNGSALELMKDDSLIITLEANASTGYQWRIVKNDAAILKPAGPPEYKAGKSAMIGAPGQAVFTFSAVKPGSEEMVLGYARANDHDPAKTFAVNIRVSTP